MNLRPQLLDALQALEDSQAKVKAEAERLLDKEAVLDHRAGELAVLQDELAAREAKVADAEAVDAQRQANSVESAQLDQRAAELKLRETRLNLRENDLFGIQSRQDAKETELLNREKAVTEREQTFEETIKGKLAASLVDRLTK